MQIALNVQAVETFNYLGLDLHTLEAKRLANEVRVLWTRIPAIGMRVAVMLAPLGMAWGMQFRLRSPAYNASDEAVGSDVVASALKTSIEELGFKPEKLPGSLLGCEVFGREQQLWLGREADDIPHAQFRAVIMPDTDFEFADFLHRLQAHVDQLGKFFLLPVPSGVELQRWQYEEDVRLTELLSGRPGGLRKGQSTQGWEGAIRLAIESLDGSEAEAWLTPAFLEHEQVKTSYPIRKEGVSVTARAAAFLAMLNMRPVGEQLKSRKAVTMLKLQLIRKWKWPLGLRQLHHSQTSESTRTLALAGGEACEEAEALVAEILEEGMRRYPVLFE